MRQPKEIFAINNDPEAHVAATQEQRTTQTAVVCKFKAGDRVRYRHGNVLATVKSAENHPSYGWCVWVVLDGGSKNPRRVPADTLERVK